MGPFFDLTNRTNPDGSLTLGPYPTQKGDRWTIRVSVQSPFEAGYTTPHLTVSPPLVCESQIAEVETFSRPSIRDLPAFEMTFHELMWQCTSRDDGVVELRVDTGSGGGATYTVAASNYPSYPLHAHMVTDDSLFLVGSIVGIGAVLLAVCQGYRTRDARSDATAAAALAGASVFWPLALWLTLRFGHAGFPREGDVAVPIILGAWALGALTTATLAALASHRWRQRPSEERTIDTSRLAALGATLVLPLGPFIPLAIAFHGPWVAILHMAVGLLVVGAVLRR